MAVGSLLRKPLGLFAAVVVVGLILIGVGMTAFGGTPSAAERSATPLTPMQFAHANERICLSVRHQLRSLVAGGKPHNLRQVTTYLRRGTAIVDQLRSQYYRLIPPPAAVPSFRRLLGKLDAEDSTLNRLNHMSETRQWRRFVLLTRTPWFKHAFHTSHRPKKLRDMCRWASHGIA